MITRYNISFSFIFFFALLFLVNSSFTLKSSSTSTLETTVSIENTVGLNPPRSKKERKKRRKKRLQHPQKTQGLSYGVAILLGVLGILFAIVFGVAALSLLGNIVWNLWLGSLLAMIALGVVSILSLVGAILSIGHASKINKNNSYQTPYSENNNSKLAILWGVLLLILFLGAMFFGITLAAIGFAWSPGLAILGIFLILGAITALIFSIIFFKKASPK